MILSHNGFSEGDYVEIADDPGFLYAVKELGSETLLVGRISSIDGDWMEDVTVSPGDMIPASPETLSLYQAFI